MACSSSARMVMACLAALSSSAACNFGPATFRLGEVRIEYDNGGGTSVETVSVTYDDSSRVEEIETNEGSDLRSRHEYNYDEGRLVEIEVTNQNEIYDLEVTWEENLLVALEGDSGDVRHEHELRYVESTNLLEEHSYQATSNGYSYTSKSEMEYDDKNRWEEVNVTVDFDFPFGGSSTSVSRYEIEWGDDGRPAELQLTTTNGSTESETWEFGYDDGNKIEDADDNEGGDVEVTYDDAGRIAEIVVRDGNSRVTYEYEYEDGNVGDGFVFLPEGLLGVFDLAGNPVERPQVYSTQFLPSYGGSL